MAESDPIQQYDGKEISILASLTDCPICLNQIQFPKSLPCLHTFCKECLDAYINKHAENKKPVLVSFPCPICRGETRPVEASVSPSSWAEQYPTNNFILAILDSKNLQLSIKMCNPCQKKHKLEKEATLWCRNCNMLLCDDCKEDHDFYTEGHTVFTSKEVEADPTKTLNISTKCERHDEKMKLFCEDHKVVCCSICVSIDHRKCDKVVTVKEMAKTINENKESESLLTNISTCIRTLDGLLDDSKTNMDELLNDKKRKISEMAQLRKRIDGHLDDLQKNDENRLEEAVEKQQLNIKSRMKSITNLKAAMEQSQKQIRAAEICMDDAQLVQAVQQVNSTREAYQQMVEENVSLQKQYKIVVEVNKAINGIFDLSTLTTVDDECRLAKDPFQWCNKVTLTNTVQTTSGSRITGVLFLGADSIVIVDNGNSMLSCHSAEGNLKLNFRLEGKPWDVCKIGGNGLAVTIPEEKIIALVDVMDDVFSVTGNIKIGKKCYGIARIEDKVLVTCPRDQLVLVLDTSGQIQCTIDGTSCMWHAIAPKGRKQFIVSERRCNKGKVMLPCVGENETMNSLFQSESVVGGRGMASDVFGNIYVCATDDNKVLIVSPTGQSKTILSKEDGLNTPCAIGIHDDRMVVFEETNAVGKVFKMIV